MTMTMTIIKPINNTTCAECGGEVKNGYGVATSFSQAKWKFLCKDCYSKITTDVVKVYNQAYVDKLEKQIECASCIYTDSPCIRGDYPIKENGHCSHYKHFGDEIQELRQQIQIDAEHILELQKDKGALTDKVTELENKLEKAKELLKRCYDNYVYLKPFRSEIRKFLSSEVEK